MALPGNAPAVPLYQYQQDWVNDKSRFKIALKTRQSGFSFGTALEVVLDAVEHKTTWVLLSRGERQSKELMEKVAMHARAIDYAAQMLESDFVIDDQKFRMLQVDFPNGSRIIGLPANPDTARGFSGNVVLDEFAFHADSYKIWQALFPTVTRGYKLRVISTPNGKANKFYQLWTDTSGHWSKHEVDIYRAVADGLEVDIDELHAGCESEDDWLQEFCCVFLDDAGALLEYSLITDAENDQATIELPQVFKPTGPLLLGGDIGRKRDLTVFWIYELVGDVYVTRAIIVLVKTPFRTQRENLFRLLSLPGMRRACIDSTGIGAQLAEEARERFGSMVEEINFSEAVKEELAINQLRQFQDKRVRIPADRFIREDLHSVQKTVTAAGHIRYQAERTDGHADRFWASALALHAGQTPAAGPPGYKGLFRRHFARKGAY